MPSIEEVFEKSLNEKGITFEKTETNLYKVESTSGIRTISLNNLEKNYSRDGDIDAIHRFVTNLLQPVVELPEWSELKEGLFISIEPSDVDGIKNSIHRELSDSVTAVLTYYNEEVNQVRWITDFNLTERKVEKDIAWKQAMQNLEEIVAKTTINFSDIDGEKLGMIEAHEPYKASLILTQGLKQKVSKELGWPIFAVAPARDFVYLFSKDGGLMNKVGHVVVREYLQSGYPISTEVWELADDQQKAFGAYPTE